jgi:hypothetical protein
VPADDLPPRALEQCGVDALAHRAELLLDVGAGVALRETLHQHHPLHRRERVGVLRIAGEQRLRRGAIAVHRRSRGWQATTGQRSPSSPADRCSPRASNRSPINAAISEDVGNDSRESFPAHGRIVSSTCGGHPVAASSASRSTRHAPRGVDVTHPHARRRVALHRHREAQLERVKRADPVRQEIGDDGLRGLAALRLQEQPGDEQPARREGLVHDLGERAMLPREPEDCERAVADHEIVARPRRGELEPVGADDATRASIARTSSAAGRSGGP